MNCEIISASAGTGKTYTMALKYLKALNNGVDFESILVITFTRKATAEIRERILIFLENIIFEKDNFKELRESLGVNLNIDILKKAYENMLKNSENIKIFTNDSFINKIFNNTVAPKNNIFKYEVLEKNSSEYINQILNKILAKDEYFKVFKNFYELNKNEKEIEKYAQIIEDILEKRNKIYNYIDKFDNLEYEKTNSFEKIKEEICDYLKNSNGTKTNLAKSFEIAKNITELKDFTKSGLISRSKNEFEAYYKEELIPQLVKIYVNEIIIPYNIYYKKLAKICYTIDKNLKFESCKFTFNDILFYTFKSDVDPYEIFPNIDIVMIDEFQDTDIIQFEIILKIIKHAKKLFIVGDEKQAIYGFRGGDVKLFRNIENLLKERIPNINIIKNTLNTCYRSRKNIIDFVNIYFLNRPNFNYEKVLAKKDDGYVKILNIDEDIVSNIIKNNLKINTAILVRGKSSTEKYKKLLDDNNLKYEIGQTRKLENDDTIKDIMYLFNYLITTDLYSLLSFLRSNLVGYSLEKIKKVIKNKGLKEIEILKKDNINFKKEYLKIFGYGENLDKDQIININKILDSINLHKNLKDFMDYYNEKGKNEKKEKVSEDSGINITTIHSSKGLEYDNVYVSVKKTSSNFSDFTLVELDDDIIFLKKKIYLKYHNWNKYIEKHLEDESLEELNLLYVALTRAKNNLFIYIEDPKKFNEFFNGEIIEKGNIIQNETKNITEDKVVFTNKIFFDETKYLKESDNVTHNIDMELKRKKGIALHYFMENVKDISDIDFAKSMFLRKYGNLVGPKVSDNIINTCINYIKANKNIFDSNSIIFTEYEIYDNKGKTFRIDRMNINENSKEIVIFDYKTKENADKVEEYQKQIDNYVNIIKNMKEYEGYSVISKILPIKISED